MKSLTFATYWLMVAAVIGEVSTHEQNLNAESEAVTGAAQYSFNDVDCDAVHRSVQCVK